MTNIDEYKITLINACFNEDELIGSKAPDVLIFDKSKEFEISDDFVLCRDENNNVTAMFGSNQWDFNPYRLSADKIRPFNFEVISEVSFSTQKCIMISEMKVILFHLMYSKPAGHTGMLAVSTLYNYFIILSKAAKYCFELSQIPSIGEVTLKDLFSDEKLFAAFVLEHQKPAFNSKAKALVNALLYLGESVLGYDVSALTDVDIERLDNDQTVVIPQRLYLLMGDHLEKDIQHIHRHSSRLASFLTKFNDPYFGLSKERQKALAVGGKANWRPDMEQAIKQHGLKKLFQGEFSVSNRNNLQLVLSKIQYLCKLTIHYYTGMRNQEVHRMKPNAITQSVASIEIKDKESKVIDKARVVEVVSSTTKFTGRRVQVSWFAPDEVKIAVKVLERIHEGLSALHDITLKDDWLFASSTFLRLKYKHDGSPVAFRNEHKPSWLQNLKITELDFQELVKSDDSRDWALEDDYQIGKTWPLHSHQFRRSLAYYASNAGFISEASLKSQLKHLTRAMTRYYSNNFEKAEAIFGFFNEKTGEYELPPEHIIKEFRTGIPFNMANHVLADILGSDEPLYGKTGSYIERQNEALRKGEVVIDGVRTETVKKVEKGEFAYRETLLGGCTQVGDCDSFMLGEFTSCLTCDGSIIKKSKVEREIAFAREELKLYEEGSGEYQLTKANLDELVKYKEHRIDKRQPETEEV